MFLRICFINWNIIEKHLKMNFLSSLSAKNDLLNLLCRVMVEAHFPLKPHFFIFFRLLFRLSTVLSGTWTVENRDVSSANNLGLHWNKSHTLTYCSSLQPLVVYNFSEIETTLPVLFWVYVADFWWLRGMVSICLIRKDKYDKFLLEGLLLEWLIFFLYLLQSVYRVFCQGNKSFYHKPISPFPTSVCPETFQNCCYCNMI